MKTVGFLFAIGASVTWGSVYVLDQRLLARISPLTLLFVNSIFSLALTAPLILLQKGDLGELLSTIRPSLMLIATSLALGALANYFIYSGIRLLGASNASVFEITYPFFVVLFSAMLLKETVSIVFVVGAIMIFIGVFVILGWG